MPGVERGTIGGGKCARYTAWMDARRPKLAIRTLLLCEHVSCDSADGAYTFSGVTETIGLNLTTRTNDIQAIAFEFAESLVESQTLEVRLRRLGDDKTVYAALAVVDIRANPDTKWMDMELPSLRPSAWRDGEDYALELWHQDYLIAKRVVKCVEIPGTDEAPPEPIG